MNKTHVTLGGKAKDVVTGFEGTIIAKCDYYLGSTTVCLTPGLDKEGKIKENEWFECERVEYK